MLATQSPFPQYFGTDGSPLDAGRLYFGQVNQNPETAPITVYWDAAGTQPAAQPITTLNGYTYRNGTPAQVYANSDYSLTIRDRRGRLVLSSPNSAEFSLASAISASDEALRTDLASTSDAAKGSALVGFNDALTYAVGTLGRRVADLGFLVNVPAGGVDATAAINATILRAFQSMAILLTANEVFSVTVRLEAGKDYSVLGTILIPNGIVLDLAGSRLIGPDASAGSTAYNPAGHHMIQSARWDGSSIVSNAAAANETTWRVIALGVINGTIINTNCPLNLVNVQERSFIDALSISNTSAPMRLKNCFYLRVGSQIKCLIRNSAQAANQPAVLLHGAAAHDMSLNIQIVGPAICYENTATNSFSVEIRGSMEEGYAINSIGIRANNAYCQSWMIHAYIEGVRVGITTLGTGAFFGALFAPAYVSSCEYAFKALTSSFRACTIDAASIPDEGAGIHNYVDLQAPNNDVILRTPSRGADTGTGIAGVPTNFLMGAGSRIESCCVWRDVTDVTAGTNVIAMSDGSVANKASMGAFAWEGAQMVTKNDQVPFVNRAVQATTITLNTAINYDESNMLACHIVITDFVGGPYTFNALIFGATVYPLAAFTAGKGITVNNNAGVVQLVFTGLNTNAGASYQIKGGVRHM
jgi:hypothetical protein